MTVSAPAPRGPPKKGTEPMRAPPPSHPPKRVKQMKNTEPKISIYLGKDEAFQQDVELLKRWCAIRGTSLSKVTRELWQSLADENRSALDGVRRMIGG